MDVNEENLIYQRIGEILVSFQWIESRFREIGWLILDPKRTDWPPLALRKESNMALLEKVRELYLSFLFSCEKELPKDLKDDFISVVEKCHSLRRYRNKLLHAAFIEFKTDDELLHLVRSDIKIKRNKKTGQIEFDNETLSSEGLKNKLKEISLITLALNRHYIQLIHATN